MDSLDPAAILSEDPHLIAVNKPAPLLTQAAPGIPNLESLVKGYIKEKYHKPGGVYLGVPHRLDRAVSGAIVFARNTKSAQRVHAQFEARTVKKIYWAWVDGEIIPAHGTWEDWIRKVPGEAKAEIAGAGEAGAKPGVLHYRVLRTIPGGTLLELAPETGRMHQLRVQSARRGHAIWGDTQYGSSRRFGPAPENPRDQVIALHARRLTIHHPFGGAEMIFEAPLPGYWPTGSDSAERPM